MRRVPLLVSLVAVALLALVVVGRSGVITLAQEATPEEAALAGISFTPLGFGTAPQLPTAPANFVLIRFGIEPGASFPIEASDPTVTLVVMEAGTLTIQVEAPIQVTRSATIAAFATPGGDPCPARP